MKSLPWLRVACSLVCGGLAFFLLWHAPWLRPRAVIENCLDDEFEFSPDSQRLVVWMGGGWHLAKPIHPNEPGIRIHDVATGGKLCTLEKSEELVAFDQLALSPNGRLVGYKVSEAVLLWETATGRQIMPASTVGAWRNSRFFFSPDSDVLFDFDLHGKDGITTRLRDRKAIADFNHLIENASPADAESGALAAWAGSKEVRVIDRFTGQILHTFPLPSGKKFEYHRIWAGGKIYSAHRRLPDRGCLIWAAPGREPTRWERLDSTNVFSISDDGIWLAYSERLSQWTWIERALKQSLGKPLATDALQIVRMDDGENAGSIRNGRDARFSPDGRTLAVSFADGRIELWDFPLRKPTLLIVLLSVLVGVSVYTGSRWWQKRRRAVQTATVAPSGLRPVGTADNSPAR